MSENNKTYRIRTNVGSTNNGPLNLDVNLLQDYDIFEILSLKIDTENLYHLHTAKYGCLVGRVLANGGVGIPNAKISVFIPAETFDLNDPIFTYIYPYTSTKTKNQDYIRYNLLTDQKLDACHQNIGTFPNKRLVLDDDNYLDVFDKYYKFTTTTNGSGDYMIFGLPVGSNIIHTDLDLSDIGILSQKPRDLFYKGYTTTQFENASQFKKDTNLDNLTQVISQDSSIDVSPFWGDETENANQIKITRSDVDINYKFEPTCIFIGSIVSDEKSNAISKKCIPSERMGKMDRLTTGRGTIEMIRKTLAGNTESITIQGNELIDGNGTWCYQIPMNLDYMKTDEYGNLVPTIDTDNGIPTRTRVRFRVSLADYESDYENTHLVKVLVPHNPKIVEKKVRGHNKKEKVLKYDYQFGSSTADESYRDLFWNNVYTVKQYVPRIQKGNRQRNKNFTGFKAVNVNGANNPIPYNNMRINLTFLFVFQCLIFKSLVMIVKFLNKLLYVFDKINSTSNSKVVGPSLAYITLDGGMCPNLEGNYIAPGAKEPKSGSLIIENTYHAIIGDKGLNLNDSELDSETKKEALAASGTTTPYDSKSSDVKNGDYTDLGKLKETFTNDDDETEAIKVYNNEDYFVKCVELQFAMEYEVIQFDFYNDWINGMLYIPRWFAEARKNKDGMVYCGENFNYSRNLVQQCALKYEINGENIKAAGDIGCTTNGSSKQRCHKKSGRRVVPIFGSKHGIVERLKTSRGHYAYYLRPSELIRNTYKKANLFATDLVLLGSVNECNQYGLPTVNGYTSSSYIMPPPTGEIVYDTQEMEFNYGDYSEKFVGIVYAVDNSRKSFTMNEMGVSSALVGLKLSINDIIEIIGGDGKKYIYKIKEIVRGDLNRIFYKTADRDTDEEVEISGNIKIGNSVYKLFSDISYKLFQFNKVPLNNVVTNNGVNGEEEHPYPELAGIDWGYNPYMSGTGKTQDDTTKIINQTNGHFLEIGCVKSLSNIKSCINLSRICEIGSEMSQSHYYETTNNFVRPAGLIGKREVNNDGIRTTFATLNSNSLETGIDIRTGYLRYNFKGYVPNAFMGEVPTSIAEFGDLADPIKPYKYIEGDPKSYKAFRFGTTGLTTLNQQFLITEQVNNGEITYYSMPVYENSFYFYFGLRDGSTAIDRLYTEYYAECPKDTSGQIEEPSLTLTADKITQFTINGTNGTTNTYGTGKIHYVVEGLGTIREEMITVQFQEFSTWKDVTPSDKTTAWTTYIKEINITNNYIEVKVPGLYKVTFKNSILDTSVSGEIRVETRSINPDLNPSVINDNLNISVFEGRDPSLNDIVLDAYTTSEQFGTTEFTTVRDGELSSTLNPDITNARIN